VWPRRDAAVVDERPYAPVRWSARRTRRLAARNGTVEKRNHVGRAASRGRKREMQRALRDFASRPCIAGCKGGEFARADTHRCIRASSTSGGIPSSATRSSRRAYRRRSGGHDARRRGPARCARDNAPRPERCAARADREGWNGPRVLHAEPIRRSASPRRGFSSPVSIRMAAKAAILGERKSR